MRDQGYITEEEYQDALADDVYARIESNDVEVAGATTYSYFVDTVIEKVMEDLQEQKGYTESQASNLIYKGGLSIYTTQDMAMQEIADSVINDPDYYPANTEYSISYNVSIKSDDGTVSSYSHYGLLDYYNNTLGDSTFTLTFKSQEAAQEAVDTYREYLLSGGGTVSSENLTFTLQPQMSFTLIEQSTGYVKVIVGGRGEKSGSRTLNRATSSTRQPGSSIKPLVAYGPGLDTGTISLATPIDDAPYYYSGEDARVVKNYTEGQYRGLISVRKALTISQNVPAVKVLTEITPQVGFNYLTKLGLSSLVSPKNAINGNHDVVQSLALGGMTLGVYNIDMTSAYSAIANGGVRVEPIYYTKVLDSDGNVILDNSTPETTRVFKETTAWLLTNGLQSVVDSSDGTGRAAALSSQPVAGKTGTTQYDSDKWFCGFTPYYTASIWLGYDDNSKALPSSINHTKMWHDIMEQIHAGLETGEFKQPDSGIEEVEVCSQSGKRPIEGLCDQDPRGSQLVTDYFATDQVPAEDDYCDIHIRVTICNETGQIARSGCTNTTTKIMIKKSAVNIPTDIEEEEIVDYTTWDQEYSITQDELNNACSKHSGASTYNSSTASAGTSGTTSATTKAGGTTSSTTKANGTTSSTTKASGTTSSTTSSSNTTATTKASDSTTAATMSSTTGTTSR
jgi:penicillin-binding protein 1A